MEQRRTISPLRSGLWAATCSVLLACSVDHVGDSSDDAGLHTPPPGAASSADASPGAASADAGSSAADAASAVGDAATCPGSVCALPADAGPGDASTSPVTDAGSAGGGDAGASSQPDAGPMQCTPFPSFDRSCATNADCAIGTRTLNCCGTLMATGIRKSEEAGFRAVVTKCQAGQPICDCLSGPTRADDGSVDDFTNSAFLRASCIAGECWTSYHELPARTPCGNKGFTCDLNSEICLISPAPNGDTVVRCAPVPTACERDRTCGCAATEVCRGLGHCSHDVAPNTLMCPCTTCS